MPVRRRGVLFGYFDKVICGIVVVGLILAIGYAAHRKASGVAKVDVRAILQDAELIENKLLVSPPPVTVIDHLGGIRQRLTAKRGSGTVRSDMMGPPRPQQYPTYRVGTDKDFTLRFTEPLEEGSIEIKGDGKLVELVEHPVNNDYREVHLRSTQEEGSVRVVGQAGDTSHIYPVIADAKVGKTAYPPVELVVGDEQGRAVLEFAQDPLISKDEVEVVGYEIWRRDWSDPIGSYNQVGTIDLTGGRAMPYGMGGARQPMPFEESPLGMMGGEFPGDIGGRPGAAPGLRQPGMARQAEEVKITWEDLSVIPGERYSYKIRTVGANTFPAKGDFGDPIEVDVLRNIAFRFTGIALDKVHFEVIKLRGLGATSVLGGVVRSGAMGGGILKEEFYVTKGEEIGGVVEYGLSGAVENFLTGATLVDYHPAIIRKEKSQVSSRVVYADAEGNLHVCWRGESKSKLWDAIDRVPGRRAPGGRTGFVPGTMPFQERFP